MNRANYRMSLVFAGVLIVAVACPPNLAAQDTRAEVLEQERAAKTQASQTTPSTGPSWLERSFSWGESRLQAVREPHDGFHVVSGGMIPGAGIAVGPGYRQQLFGNRAIVDASGAVSWRRYTTMRTRLEWPRAFTDRLSLGADASYQDFTQVNFFGIGDGSLKSNQTNYRVKGVDVLGFATVRPNEWLSLSGRVGVLRVGIGSGTSALSPATGDRFDETAAPGIARQHAFLHGDASVDIDTRDAPDYPTRGGRYQLSIASFQDQNYGQYSFRRLSADAGHNLPLFHKSWVLTLRGRAVFTQNAGDQAVPFYMLPTLGGANTLRGFADYRFRDRNLLLLNAEYRWPLFRAMDGALFYDAGTVAASPQALSMRHAHSDFGIGVRAHTSTRTIIRVDVARSVEGIRGIVAFSAPLGGPSRTIAPYVP
jgi:outer membrane protein assembly factor BamA